MDIVVVGGGMAGARLAHRLGQPHALPGPHALAGAPGGRTDGDRIHVTLVAEEPHRPYNRVLLAEVLAGRLRPEQVALPAPGRLVSARAVRLDRDERLLHCDDGSVLSWDRLVLATGANPVLPPLRGLFRPGDHDLPAGVHAFRTMDDCLALSAAVRPGVRAVVVGGGLLGVSAAQALAARGAQVVVAQQGEHLMDRHLDAQAAALLHTHLTAQGVEVHTSCRVRGVLTADDGPARTVRAVELADGYRLDADLVVLACGVRPRVGLAEAAGIAVAKGVVVDDQLRTSDPAVFAAGDCAQHAGTVYGLAGAARDQADVLAQVLAAEALGTREAPLAGPRYTGTRALTRLTLTPARPPVAGTAPGPALDLAAFGEVSPLPGDDVLHLTDATRGSYRKVVVRGDRLAGGVLLGDLAAVGAVARAWEGDEPLPSAPLIHLLTDDGGF
ncbi:NAD(P)/FAD-dependent oxidoreductase [Actinacidiphila acididurans]|uniref:NAD(P)/FAD-dependent oxidoreductase n=1 Tax=Actinacidiphila acididurans TaxID=2784346 RepID=A0ABS2U282_9ACTN|nr:FAD-dependent oxidoreductase [Actinacidiphila acididurans]MBM9509695.1 NAD(P)/FAD-dependent oxidoreductase [Actinacidiphila acididurans]